MSFLNLYTQIHTYTHISPHKKWTFPLSISSINETKSAVNCAAYIYVYIYTYINSLNMKKTCWMLTTWLYIHTHIQIHMYMYIRIYILYIIYIAYIILLYIILYYIILYIKYIYYILYYTYVYILYSYFYFALKSAWWLVIDLITLLFLFNFVHIIFIKKC